MIYRIGIFGACACLWAFFGPVSFGNWLGTITHAFLTTAGLL